MLTSVIVRLLFGWLLCVTLKFVYCATLWTTVHSVFPVRQYLTHFGFAELFLNNYLLELFCHIVSVYC